jgi:sporulation protein YlmC with PRC-barrel domain
VLAGQTTGSFKDDQPSRCRRSRRRLRAFAAGARRRIRSRAEHESGYTNRAPRTPTVSETADQIRATQAIGDEVRDSNGEIVAKITDLIGNRQQGTVELAILGPAGSGSFKNPVTVAWGTLQFEGKPTPHFVTALSKDALAAGAPPQPQGAAQEYLFHVKSDLLGKKAVGADGTDLGKVSDVVFSSGDGRIAAVVIDTGGLISSGAKQHAVAWDEAKPQPGKENGSVRLALSRTEG